LNLKKKLSGLKAPPKFDDMGREPNKLWLKERGGYLSLVIQKVFSESTHHHSTIVHQIQFIPKEQQAMVQRTYAYNIIVDHATQKGKATCVFDPSSKMIHGTLNQKFFDKKLTTDFTFTNQPEPVLDSKFAYRGSDFTLNANIIPSKSKYETGYTQSITPLISAGVSLALVDDISSLSSSLRFHRGTEHDSVTFVGNHKSKQGKDVVKLSYVQDITLGMKFGSEATWKIQDRKFNYKVGAQLKWMKSEFGFNVMDDNQLQVQLQHSIAQRIQVSFGAALDPEGSLEYSLGFQFASE